MTFRSSLQWMHIKLFDEDHGKMIGYHRLEDEIAPEIKPEAPHVGGIQLDTP
jgi:hypothetical protein